MILALKAQLAVLGLTIFYKCKFRNISWRKKAFCGTKSSARSMYSLVDSNIVGGRELLCQRERERSERDKMDIMTCQSVIDGQHSEDRE